MRILVVEDEHRIANTIKKGLEQERLTVDLAYDGNDGFDLAVDEAYDVIVLDLMLPGMSGLQICEKLRQSKIHTPILMLTAKSQIQDKVTGFQIGADDYLTKPFSFEELLERIRALARRPAALTSETLEIQDLSLNPRTFTVSRQHQTISLSGKEFALLEYLMRHPHQIISKTQIIEHVWNYEADVLPNTVEVFIRHLRDKIDRPFDHLPSLIQTVRGFGYRLGD